MTPDEVKAYYKSGYNFRKVTKMSCASLGNWLRWGFVPRDAQYKLEAWTKGALKVDLKYKAEASAMGIFNKEKNE